MNCFLLPFFVAFFVFLKYHFLETVANKTPTGSPADGITRHHHPPPR